MRMFQCLLGLSFTLVALPMGAQSNLNDYLLAAVENNPGLKADFAEYLAAVQKVPQVGALPDPNVALGYFASPAETRVGPVRGKVSLSQKLPWFGLLEAREDVAAERAKGILERFEENKSRLFFELRTTYYDLYFVARALTITEENIAILESLKQLALIRFEAGKSSAVNELRVEMDQVDLENQLITLQDQYYQLQVRFNTLSNENPERLISVPLTLWEDLLEENREMLFDRIIEQNHSIQQIEHRILSLKHQETVAAKESKVDFSIGLDYSFVGGARMPLADPGESGQDTIVFPKIGISIPLSRKKYRAMASEASQKVSASSFERLDRINTMRSQFEGGYNGYRDAHRRVTLFREQSQIAGQALDLLLADFTTDGQGFEEVLRMEKRLLGYELALDRARSDQNSAVAFIKYLLGE